MTLLQPGEPAPVTVTRGGAESPFFLTVDHAGRRIPERLGDLGLPESELSRHIAWDIGIAQVSRLVAEALAATMVAQTYSRLVIDCNRPPAAANAIPEVSEATPIPGNTGIGADERVAREAEIFRPYHEAIAAELDRRQDRPTLLVAMHSFTPVYLGEARPWQIGTLYREPGFAQALGDLLRAEPDLTVGDNQPYSVSDATDYTIPVHAERRRLPHVGIEIRQDLIADEPGQRAWAERLTRLLPQAWARRQAR